MFVDGVGGPGDDAGSFDGAQGLRPKRKIAGHFGRVEFLKLVPRRAGRLRLLRAGAFWRAMVYCTLVANKRRQTTKGVHGWNFWTDFVFPSALLGPGARAGGGWEVVACCWGGCAGKPSGARPASPSLKGSRYQGALTATAAIAKIFPSVLFPL